MNFAVIGLGSFGLKRALAIKNSTEGNLKRIFDLDNSNSKKASEILELEPTKEFNEILNDTDINSIVICTPNKFHKELIIKGLNSGKNIFCEKPLAISVSEANKIQNAANKNKLKVQIGSNHRYFETVKFAKKLIEDREIGEILSFSGRIGHSGERIKNSWFWDKKISGGGTLIDNGCHLLDLSRFFIGDFYSGTGLVTNLYWKKNISVEDTAAGIYLTKDGRMATIFSSWRLQAGYFFIELNGTDGYINIDGRFDTHGGDKIFWRGKNKKIQSRDFSNTKPNSQVDEINNFISCIKTNKECSPNIKDGLEVLKMVEYIYSKK